MSCNKCSAPCQGALCKHHEREQYRDWDIDIDEDDQEDGDD